MRQFLKIESLYEAHKQTTLPLVLLKFKHDMHVDELMPQSPLELLDVESIRRWRSSCYWQGTQRDLAMGDKNHQVSYQTIS